ncbi:hypothetical protein [Streptomyces sp. CC208A]|uniref:hypothetical protein n=1 Tax=Streptomyces sp. CC208A TaxID=3044573 RepID=UPI0024A9C958|nr:hypothetical protein [Streptomyces sp. CC208A]
MENKNPGLKRLWDTRKLAVPPSIIADWARGREEEARKAAARNARRECKKEAAR